NNTASPLADSYEVWGAAANDAAGILYTNDGSTLQTATYGDIGTVSTVTIADATGAALSMVSLAFGNDTLYGSRNVANEGVYAIDPVTGVASIVVDYEDADFDFGGLSFNPADGLLYGTNDDASPNTPGLYSIDPNSGAINFVVAYPNGETDIDGAAIGDGIAYFVTDEPGDIFRYDLVAGTFLSPLTNPVVGSEIFSGGAWAPGLIPEPTSLGLLGLAGLALVRRRR
ncbi:MAG: PEP-CTERM sorting domain-containing protein, partial [Planctomycetota bacterium]